MPKDSTSPRQPLAAPVDAPGRKRLPLLLRRSWYGLNQAFRRRIAHLSITPDQFTVLRNLLENKSLTQRELTHLMSSDPNTVTSLLARMARAGLVSRRTHETDRRANRLALTAKGKRTYDTARRIAVEMQTEILSTLPRPARELFLESLALVADACQSAAKQSAK